MLESDAAGARWCKAESRCLRVCVLFSAWVVCVPVCVHVRVCARVAVRVYGMHPRACLRALLLRSAFNSVGSGSTVALVMYLADFPSVRLWLCGVCLAEH